jgi:hypothetical protein
MSNIAVMKPYVGIMDLLKIIMDSLVINKKA